MLSVITRTTGNIFAEVELSTKFPSGLIDQKTKTERQTDRQTDG